MSTVTDNRKNTLTTLVAAFVLINFTASSVLAATGISDYRYTVSLSRAGILVAVILAAYFVGSALYRRKINTKLLITVTISAGSAIVFVMLDLDGVAALGLGGLGGHIGGQGDEIQNGLHQHVDA